MLGGTSTNWVGGPSLVLCQVSGAAGGNHRGQLGPRAADPRGCAHWFAQLLGGVLGCVERLSALVVRHAPRKHLKGDVGHPRFSGFQLLLAACSCFPLLIEAAFVT